VVLDRRIRHDAGVEPWVADIWNSAHQVARCGVLDLDEIDPRPMRRMAGEVAPAFDGARFQLFKRADDFEIAGLLIDPDGKGETPEAFLGDHPVAHVLEPIEFA